MNNMPMQMNPYMHNAFWYLDQITITFKFKPGVIPFVQPDQIHQEGLSNQEKPLEILFPTFDKINAILASNSIVDQSFNAFLSEPEQNYPTLKSIDFSDTLRSPGDTPPAEPDQVGKYVFTSLDKEGHPYPTVIGFFKFEPRLVPSSDAADSSEQASMGENGSSSENQGYVRISPVIKLVTKINENLEILQQKINDIENGKYEGTTVSASPIWLTGGSSYTVPVGCPLSPPIPVPADVRCSSSPGLWPITLTELPTDLERMTGDAVHVIILDTLPREEDLKRALEGAEDHNLLLLDVFNNVQRHYNQLPALIDVPNPSQPKTGKDVKGRNGGGFRMADHGLFIAGIVRDIAPEATVECIRSLNDFCAGDSKAFVKILEKIQNRMLLFNPDDQNKPGDLYNKPVVINLSLVIPPDKDLIDQGVKDPSKVREEMYQPLKALVDMGALFVASAGNEGDTRYQPANPMHERPDALYPAQFAYQGVAGKPPLGNSMIPVGAVDKHGDPTTYSCYPGDLGIATYGGDVPKHFKKDESGCFTEAKDIDALIGIYSALSYPSLLLEDCRPTYPVPNAHAWAYWSGTSFATPIITGLVARIRQFKLENPLTAAPPNISLPQALGNMGAVKQITWDRLVPDEHSALGNMIVAVQQCASKNHDDDDDKRERVDIHVTINERD
jgi:Subtilase family